MNDEFKYMYARQPQFEFPVSYQFGELLKKIRTDDYDDTRHLYENKQGICHWLREDYVDTLIKLLDLIKEDDKKLGKLVKEELLKKGRSNLILTYK